jgi:UDP-glucose 4-epimerase
LTIKTALIGGSGFIGSYLSSFLSTKGREVSVIGRSKNPKNQLQTEISYLSGDITNKKFADSFLSGSDEIIYLAHNSTPRTSFDNPFGDLNENLITAVSFFEVACQYPIKKIIYISSGGAVYGETEHHSITEDHPTNPISPYGITKLAIEKYTYLFYKKNSLPVICLRPSNVFGSSQKPFIGQGFISTAIASILTNKEIVIYGEKGTTRDYLYINDFAKAIFLALEFALPGQIYNIGSGIGISNNDIIDKLKANHMLKEKLFNVSHREPRPSDVNFNILNSSKFKKLSSWSPEYDIDVGMDEMVTHFLKKFG